MGHALRIARISTLVLVLAGVVVVWPASLGGSTVLVTTHGTSMEPRFSTGDLAVLSPDDSYQVGDVIAYHSDSLDTTVMHRIVDRDGDRFVTQGDNNGWLDADHPAVDQVKGSLWFRVPQGGKALAALTSPAVLGGVFLAIGTLMVALRRPRRAARARRGPAARRGLMLPASRLSPADRALARQILIGSSVLAVLSLTTGSALLVLPDDQTESRALPVTQSGEYTYSGEAFPGTTYPDGHVDTGDPIYTALAGPLTVSYEQSLASGGNLATDGTVRLGLSLSAPDGWTTEMDGGSPVPMQDSTATATVALDTVGAAALLAAHYAEVGVNGGAATLTVTPQVDVDGTVDGRPFALPAAPQLAFTLDPAALTVVGGQKALQTSADTTVSVDEIVHRTFTLGAVTLSIGDARVLALGVGVLALILMVAATWLGGARSTSPVDAFLQRRAARVLAVSGFAPDGTVVDVGDPEALYKVATRLDALVLHHAGPDGDIFAVRDIGTTYRCVVPRAAVPEPQPRPVRAGRMLRRFA